MTTTVSFSARRATRPTNFKHHPLTWSLPAPLQTPIRRLVSQVLKYQAAEARGVVALAKDILDWLKSVEPDLNNSQFAHECLVWAYALRSVGEHLDDETREEIGELLETIQQDAAASLSAGLEQQLLVVELPLVLQGVSASPENQAAAIAVARETLRRVMHELLDEKGTPHVSIWPVIRSLLACWTRCLELSLAEEVELFDEASRLRFDLLVFQLLQMSRADGSQLFSDAPVAASELAMLSAAVGISGYPYNHALAALAVPDLLKSKPRKKNKSDELPLSHFSEISQVAIKRSAWDSPAAQLGILYEGSRVFLEMNCGARQIVSGEWLLQASVNNEILKPTSAWEQVCWSSDDEADFLEIEMRLTHGWRIQRQIVLARRDRAVFLAEALLGTERGQLELRSTLTLGKQIHFSPAPETREGSLVEGTRPVALVLPLSLPEWRCDHEPGSLSQIEQGLSLHQRGVGSSLYLPWFLDLHGRRRQPRKQVTWRRLSVAEHLVNQPRDVAAGYRVQLDDRQWLVYRALESKANRTVLGKNLCCDFFFGHFTANGKTETLIEIE